MKNLVALFLIVLPTLLYGQEKIDLSDEQRYLWKQINKNSSYLHHLESSFPDMKVKRELELAYDKQDILNGKLNFINDLKTAQFIGNYRVAKKIKLFKSAKNVVDPEVIKSRDGKILKFSSVQDFIEKALQASNSKCSSRYDKLYIPYSKSDSYYVDMIMSKVGYNSFEELSYENIQSFCDLVSNDINQCSSILLAKRIQTLDKMERMLIRKRKNIKKGLL